MTTSSNDSPHKGSRFYGKTAVKPIRRANLPDDPGPGQDGVHFGRDLGTTLIYSQSPFLIPDFPLEVVISVGLHEGVKVWCVSVPDLGILMTAPYWSSEG